MSNVSGVDIPSRFVPECLSSGEPRAPAACIVHAQTLAPPLYAFCLLYELQECSSPEIGLVLSREHAWT